MWAQRKRKREKINILNERKIKKTWMKIVLTYSYMKINGMKERKIKMDKKINF